jgi:hypothetical protein
MSDNPTIYEFSENIADAEAPLPLPEREYPGTITAVATKEDSKGNPYASVTWSINADDYPADYPLENAPDGKQITQGYIGLTDDVRTRFRLKRFIEAIGGKTAKRIDVTEWIGLTGKITIKHETYDGLIRENISKVNPA